MRVCGAIARARRSLYLSDPSGETEDVYRYAGSTKIMAANKAYCAKARFLSRQN